MEARPISACFLQGLIAHLQRDDSIAEIGWTEHPRFKGVYLKHLVRGADTEGGLSCHLVKIDPDCALENHIHENEWEIHEVIEGEGSFLLGAKETFYCPGRVGIIPKGATHRVIAGSTGLVLLAKFFPALM